MTVSNTTAKLTYAGNGSARDFGISFPLLSAEHLRIIVTDTDGTEMEINNNYTLSLNWDSITYPTLESGLPPLALGQKITLLRQTPLTQEMDLCAGQQLDAEALEHSADKLTYLLQELKEQVQRCVKYAVSVSNEQSAEQFLKDIIDASNAAQNSATAAVTAATQADSKATQAAASAQQAANAASAAATEKAGAASAAAMALEYRNAANGFSASAATAAQEANTAKTDAVAAKNAAQDFKDSAAASASAAGSSLSAVEECKTAAQGARDSAAASAAAASASAQQAAASATQAQGAAADSKIAAHNTDTAAHADIRALIKTYRAGANIVIDPDGTIHATGGGGTGGNIDVDGSILPSSNNPVANSAIYAALQNKQAALSAEQLSAANSGITASKVADYEAHLADTEQHLTTAQKSTWNGKQDAISDLSAIRSNASAGKNAADTISAYGDIVTHAASEFQPAGNYAAETHTHADLAGRIEALEEASSGSSAPAASGTLKTYSFSMNNYTKEQFSNGSDNSTWQSGSIMGVASKIIKAEMQVGITRTVSGTNYTAWSAFPATAFIYMRNTTSFSTNITYNVAWTSAAVSNWATSNGVFKSLQASDTVSTRLVVYFE